MKLRQIIISLIAITGLFACLATTTLASPSLTHQTTRFNSSISKSDFSTTDNPQIKLKQNPAKVSGIFKFIPKFIYSPPAPPSLVSTIKVTLKNADNKIVNDINPKIEEINGEVVVTLDKSKLRPGKYFFEISTDSNNTIVQDFTWGVLSLNPDQTPYSIGDTAFMAIAVLDNYGNMVCDSALTLTITKPDGTFDTLSTQNGLITKNDVCHTKQVTLIPDYQALYPITQTGNYNYTLTATNQNGTYSISDSFISQNNPDFVIKRLDVTRIFPLNTYPVTLKITANQDFVGTITESVPSSFKITNTTAKITTQADRQLLTWNITLSKGQITSLKYSYLAPPISPERYLLGPAIFSQKNKVIYTEPRVWQIASDAVLAFTNVGTTQWVVPNNVVSITVEAWGGGGGGGDGNNNGGGGGGGGAYATGIISVTPQNSYTIVVGAGGTSPSVNNSSGSAGGDSSFNGTDIVAAGGSGGTNTTGGSGGLASASVGSTKFDGGNGGSSNNTGDVSGGGGGAAGPLGIGFSGQKGIASSVGGTGGTGNNGSGGIGGYNVNGNDGTDGQSDSSGGGGGGGGDDGLKGGNGGAVGGGGGGGETNSTNTAYGNGGNGQVIITYTFSPSTPTLISPADSAVNQSMTPSFQTVTTDAENENLQYELKICTDSNMSTNCQTFDQTSSNVGWSGQDIGTSAYSSGTTATYVLQVGNSLAPNTTYYWKTRAIDYSGSNTWSSTQATPFSFTTLNHSPNQPTNSTPANSTSGVLLTPTLTASAFSDPDAGDTQSASQWQVATDTGFTNIVFDTGTSGSATNTVNVTTTLSVGTTYYWHVRYQDSHNDWSSYSSYTNFTTNLSPNTPTLVYPTNSAVGISLTPSLRLVATDNNNDPLQYRITLGLNPTFTGTTQTFDQTISNVGWSGQNVGTSAFTSGTTATYIIQSSLVHATTYYWRAQAIDYSGTNIWGNLSVGYSFTTMNFVPQSPTNLLTETLTNPTSIIDTTPEFSAIYVDDVGDTANKYEIQVDDDSGFGSPIWDSGASGTAMTNCTAGNRCQDISYAGSALTRGTTYYWRIRFWDDYGDVGSWSVESATFSLNSIPNTPTLSLPTNGSLNNSYTPILKTVTTDVDGNYLQYKIILGTNPSFTGTTQTFDQTISNVGWSGQNVGTSAFTSGTTATYIIQTSLSVGITYYWRSYAIDPAGTNIWSSTQGSPFSFVTNSYPLTPTSLLTEGLTNPTSILDTTPEFSAIYVDDVGDIGNKYQIQVDDDSGFGSTIWDSGASGTAMTNCTAGNRCQDISYAGSALTRGTVYYWRIKYWDQIGTTSPWSGNNTFTINSAPNTPTLVYPANSAVGISQTPTFKTVTTDVDSNSLQYEVKVCIDSGMSTGCQTFTAANVGWSGADIGTSSFSSGTTATYTIQIGNSLASSTTYYWKTRAIDPTGTNIWSGTQASPYSFTTINNAPSSPTNLLTEGATNLSGILDITPEFSAIFVDLDIGDTANKYEIQVDDDSSFSSPIWDSGASGTAMTNCVVGNRCQDISYAGSALTRGTVYYWRIKYWDDTGDAGAWSVGTNTFSINSISNVPTLVAPSIGTTNVALIGANLQIVATDPNSDPLQYKIILGTNASFTGTTQTFDITTSNTNWSGMNVGTSAFTSGTTATYTIQTPLSYDTTYYWKAQSLDYSGSNIWSSFSSTGYFSATVSPSVKINRVKLNGVKFR